MEANNRRDFLKKAALAGASALMAPTLLAAEGKDGSEFVLSPSKRTDSKLIVPKNNGLKITGTFLDEISHDIPHQNWGEKEWDLDFQHMKRIGIDTVIMIRSGYRKFITYPSKYLLGKGCYMPSVDLVDMYLRLAEKYNMKFYFGLYDTGHYWDTRDMSWEVEYNKYVIYEDGILTVKSIRVSEAGILARKSAAIPKELSVHFIPWVNNAKMYRMASLLLYPLGLMVKRQSWEPEK